MKGVYIPGVAGGAPDDEHAHGQCPQDPHYDPHKYESMYMHVMRIDLADLPGCNVSTALHGVIAFLGRNCGGRGEIEFY